MNGMSCVEILYLECCDELSNVGSGSYLLDLCFPLVLVLTFQSSTCVSIDGRSRSRNKILIELCSINLGFVTGQLLRRLA